MFPRLSPNPVNVFHCQVAPSWDCLLRTFRHTSLSLYVMRERNPFNETKFCLLYDVIPSPSRLGSSLLLPLQARACSPQLHGDGSVGLPSLLLALLHLQFFWSRSECWMYLNGHLPERPASLVSPITPRIVESGVLKIVSLDLFRSGLYSPLSVFLHHFLGL